MPTYTNDIKKIAKQLLKKNNIELIIGYQKGSIPLTNKPCFANNERDIDNLIWDGNCRVNLANYITNIKDSKIGIIAKGCDSRNIITHIIEKKINRNQLYIVGIPCQGMIDRKKLINLVERDIKSYAENENSIIVEDIKNIKKTFNRIDILQTNCLTCTNKNPVIYDTLLSCKTENSNFNNYKKIDEYKELNQINNIKHQDRWLYFKNMFSKCIRCYACRNVCPLCYCPTCFVDESNPQWLGKGNNSIDIIIFHFLRAFHCAGRCTDCGACENVCPVEINMRILTKKLEKDCFELFSWKSGLSIKERPPLDTYSINDSDLFIK